jgi:hypothetical protein
VTVEVARQSGCLSALSFPRPLRPAWPDRPARPDRPDRPTLLALPALAVRHLVLPREGLGADRRSGTRLRVPGLWLGLGRERGDGGPRRRAAARGTDSAQGCPKGGGGGGGQGVGVGVDVAEAEVARVALGVRRGALPGPGRGRTGYIIHDMW